MGRREGWGLSPVGWVLVHVIAVVELGTIVGWWRPLGTLGIVHVPASVVPGLVLLGLFGPRLVSRRWLGFLLWAGAIAAVPAWYFRDLFDGPSGLAGFALAALHEEVVFRAAFPLIVWRFLDRAGTAPAWSRAGAILLPAVLFAVLPNHLRQADTALGVLPFFTFAVFLGMLVRRPDVLPAAALTHLTVNLLTIPVLYGMVNPLARSLAVGLLLMVFASVALFVAGRPEPEGEGEPVPGGGIPADRGGVGSWDPTF
ncbi:MAG: CPBP family glutamic-type intramembrane protease [Acidimicrobiia bacterium]